jgi:acetyl esterase/lipase
LFAALGAGALCGPAGASAAEARAVQETLDVRYHEGSSRQKLDVVAPAGARGAPVVLFVHGGGWIGGDKDFFGLYRGVGRYLARHGILAVLANYRLSPTVRHPEHVKDVARAFAWTRQHAAEYGGNPDCIILCGHSAGAHLVSLLATDDRYLKSPELKLALQDRAAIKGVAAVSGVYRIPLPEEFNTLAAGLLHQLLEQAGIDPHEAAGVSGLLLAAGHGLNPFRRAFGDDPQVCKDASPVCHVRPGLPPFLVMYAERELPGLPDMARDFAAALRRAGNTVELLAMPGCSHSRILFHLLDADDPVGQALLAFVARAAGQRP